jgi:hypothetical protein
MSSSAFAIGKVHRHWLCSIEDRRFPFTANLKILIRYMDGETDRLDPSAWTTVLIDNAETLREATKKIFDFADWLGMDIHSDGMMRPKNSVVYEWCDDKE